MLLTWDQCNELFWPRGDAPVWGCVCRMQTTNITGPFDFQTGSAAVPYGVSVRRVSSLHGISSHRRDFGLASRLPAEKDDPVLVYDAMVLRRHRADGTKLHSVTALLDGRHVGGSLANSVLGRPARVELSLSSHGLAIQISSTVGKQ